MRVLCYMNQIGKQWGVKVDPARFGGNGDPKYLSTAPGGWTKLGHNRRRVSGELN